MLGDIRDRDLLTTRMRGVDLVFHAAAYKHVVLCEESPSEAIATNVRGTQNVIDTARNAGVRRVLFTSSDKAVNPTNVMGSSKLLAERVMTAAAGQAGDSGTVFASTRFGNVLGSRGSVVPVFAAQIARGGPITITDRRMTRFVMTVDEAADLVLSSMTKARGGEVFVTKMHAVEVETLAHVMRDELAPVFGYEASDVEIVEIGPQAGEKFHEELTNAEEIRRTVEEGDLFTVLPPLLDQKDPRYAELLPLNGGVLDQPYNSDTQVKMSYSELRSYLRNRGILDFSKGDV